MVGRRPIRYLVLGLTGGVAATSVAGGIALITGAIWPGALSGISPPLEYLEGSPFDSYLLPGIALALIVGGLHGVAFTAVLQRMNRANLAVTIAAYAIVIWIIVQMTIIPFSILQTVYLAAGLAEIGLVLIVLGVFSDDREPPRHRPPDEARLAMRHRIGVG